MPPNMRSIYARYIRRRNQWGIAAISLHPQVTAKSQRKDLQ
ncbi:hypothetical protein HID58_003677 [Brassica napus]|uniref:Uncharacterized protein n=1 Tax=Brassica napus TaxID=3708 RepID=A0ABQ8EQW2_BRANA|nr:hypothetical protein HID58_003677 [Brassica napus]